MMRRLLVFLTLFLIGTTVYAQKPTITIFSPTSGPIGTVVTITGTNFSATPANNIVYFGAVRATVSSATTTQLSVNVPAGSSYQSITVLVNGLIAYSRIPSSTTYSDGSEFTDRMLTLAELQVNMEKLKQVPRFGSFGDDEKLSDFVFVGKDN